VADDTEDLYIVDTFPTPAMESQLQASHQQVSVFVHVFGGSIDKL